MIMHTTSTSYSTSTVGVIVVVFHTPPPYHSGTTTLARSRRSAWCARGCVVSEDAQCVGATAPVRTCVLLLLQPPVLATVSSSLLPLTTYFYRYVFASNDYVRST